MGKFNDANVGISQNQNETDQAKSTIVNWRKRDSEQ